MVKIVAMFLALLCRPLFADGSSEAPNDSSKIENFIPHKFWCSDSVRRPEIVWNRIPKMRTPFNRQMGILPAPEPKSVEPNGVILKADPTVDPDMIYPKAARKRIVQERRKKWQAPRRYRFNLDYS